MSRIILPFYFCLVFFCVKLWTPFRAGAFHMIILFYIFAVVLIFLSYKSWRGGVKYLEYFRQEAAKPESDFAPMVSVIVPCRGVDEDMDRNLAALLRQDFPHYEILFAVEDETDPAVKVIETAVGKVAKRATYKLLFSGPAQSEGQKIRSLREAVNHVDDKSEIFVFADSDIRPDKNWLRNLIEPLKDESIGAATGYRWFVPRKGGLASEMRAVWNASIASALGPETRTNFCWGGSTAIRRAVFEKVNLRERWRGTLSDDFTVTRVMQENRLPIYFAPRAMVASVGDCAFGELLEFTTRQMKITRTYAPHLWQAAFAGSFLFNLVFVWAILILIWSIFSGSPLTSIPFWAAVAALALVSAFSVAKASLRLKAVKLVLKNYDKELARQSRSQNTLWLLSPALFLFNSVRALLSHQIVWRGIKYELRAPDRIIVTRPPSDTTSPAPVSSDG
jgi:ceramide glucosyltransferase